MSDRDITLVMARNAIVAALYFGLTMMLGSLSFMNIQFRISEILILLCFFRKDYSIGLILGCLIANMFSPLGLADVIFGTLATAISCLAIIFLKWLAIAAVVPVIANAFIVGAELFYVYDLPFWMSALEVAIGELVVLTPGYIFFMIIGKRRSIQKVIAANQNLDFKW